MSREMKFLRDTLDPAELREGGLENQFQELVLTSHHVLEVKNLPAIHKAPFDRLLLAQAQCEGLTFVTSNNILKNYPGSILFIPR